MSKHADVLIVGGGVIGLTTAFFCAREGASVAVIDKGDFGKEASWAGAGILPPAQVSPRLSPAERMRALSVQMFSRLSAELRELTGVDNGYLRSGGLELVAPSEECLLEEWHGGDANLQRLTETAVRELEPALGGWAGQVYHLPEMAQIRNPRHVKALIAACQIKGVALHDHCAALGFVCSESRVHAVNTSSGQMSAGKVLVASGSWTDPLLEQVGCRLHIEPVRGQIALLNTRVPVLRHIVLAGRQYIVPRPDGLVLVGSTEEKAGFDKSTTATAVSELLRLAGSLVPCLANAHLERCWAGLRPGTPDGLPFLGPVPNYHNLYVAAGHFRAGIQLSPGSAEILRDCLLDRDVAPWQRAFRVGRP